jgi:serine/threonine protein kinase
MVSAQEPILEADSVFAGRYRIRRVLGEGDRKRTYLADDTVFPRKVALALVKPSAALANPEGTRREAEALAKAGNNENVVTFHDSGSIEGIEYLVCDYLPGGTLREYMAKRAERKQPLSVEEVMRLGRRLARALAHVHGLGLIHRDVAPGNVWLDKRQMAHLGDFDSAISHDAALHPALLPPTTEAYVAPEQLNGGPFDERSDLYSLGAVLYEALTGERPGRMPRAAIASRLAAGRPGLPARAPAATTVGSVDLLGLPDGPLGRLGNLPARGVIAAEIVEDLCVEPCRRTSQGRVRAGQQAPLVLTCCSRTRQRSSS